MPKRKSPKVTLAGNPNQLTETAEVPDPYEPGKMLKVQRAMNRTAIDRVYSRGRLRGRGDTQEDANARLRASLRLLGIWEKAGGRGAGAIDYSAVKVDTSMRYSGTPETQAQALQQLARIRAFVGTHTYDMLHCIICEDMAFMSYVAKVFPHAGTQTRLDCYDALRRGLDRLIEYFGQAVGPKYSKIRAVSC